MFSVNSVLFVGVFLLFLYVMRFFSRNYYIYVLFVFPSTFLHELMHYCVSLFLNGRPLKFQFWPNKKKGYLGVVVSGNVRWYNAFFIGFAPMLLLIYAYFLYRSTIGIPFGVVVLVKLIAICFLIEGGIPSSVDIKLAATKTLPLVFILSVIVGVLYYFEPTILNGITLKVHNLWLYIYGHFI